MRLDIYDHMLPIILLSGPFVDRRTSIATLARNSSFILAWSQLYLPMYDLSICGSLWGMRMWSVYFCVARPSLCQLSPVCSHCWHIPLRGLPLRGRSLTSLGLTACRLKMPYTALRGMSMCLEKTGALIPFLLRAMTLQPWRIVVRGIWGRYQYYYMFCLVTYIVGSHLKSKNQEVSGFSDQWVLNAMVDFNEISHKCLPTLLFETLKVSRN